jgi:hypothetical protein
LGGWLGRGWYQKGCRAHELAAWRRASARWLNVTPHAPHVAVSTLGQCGGPTSGTQPLVVVVVLAAMWRQGGSVARGGMVVARGGVVRGAWCVQGACCSS